MFLQIKDLHFSYENGPALLKGLSLQLEKGQIGVLLGSSGSGKTSLLRCLAGFEKPQSGSASIGDEILFSASVMKPPVERKIGYLFQNLALFPHMSVEKNVLYGIEHWQEKERRQRVDELFELIELSDHRSKFPHQLSGGEKQRVALARALAPRPPVLLMDEPFSSLDSSLRSHLRHEVKRILKKLEMTSVIVTHDLEEAYEMADQVGILKQGRIETWGPKEQVFKMVTKSVPTLP